MNIGKIFEEQLGKSVPDYALIYRLADPAQSFGGGKTRFSAKNPFDFLLWDSKRHVLYALEAKTVSKKSISFERTKEDNGNIHLHQIEGLSAWNRFDGIVCGLVIEFREIEKTIFLDINEMNKVMTGISKKSFSIDDLDKNGISYFVIPQTKKRTRYTYDLDALFSRNDPVEDKESESE